MYKPQRGFCASALISAEWVKDNINNTSLSIDLDKRMISAAKKTAATLLNENQLSRMKIRYGDSSKYKGSKVDCILATNFSYFVFKDRQRLIKYFSNAYNQIEKRGLFMLDAFGGYEAHQLLEERTKHKISHMFGINHPLIRSPMKFSVIFILNFLIKQKKIGHLAITGDFGRYLKFKSV